MRFTLATAAAAVTTFAFAALTSAQSSADNPNGQRFYITTPACDSHQCQVHIKHNDTLHINWLNPVNGKINILLVPEPKQKKLKLKTYTIASKVAAHNNDDKCDKAGQASCGMYDWVVPSNVKPGKYSVDIHSLHKKGVHGYSDIVTVDAPTTAANNTKPIATKPTPQSRAGEGVPQVPANKNATDSTTEKDSTKKDASKKKKSGKKTKPTDKKKKKVHHHSKNGTAVAHHHHKNATAIHHHHKDATNVAQHHNSTSTKHDGKKTKTHDLKGTTKDSKKSTKDSKKSTKNSKKTSSKKTKDDKKASDKKATKVNAKRRIDAALY